MSKLNGNDPAGAMIRLFDGSGRVISQFHPTYNQTLDEIKFGYSDVVTRRSSAPPLSQSGAESWARNRDRLKMMADARDLVEYDFIGGMIDRIVLYVAGRIHSKSNTGDEQIDGIYDDFFHGWCGDERAEDGTTRCDITGRNRLIKMVRMAFRGFLVDGDHDLLEIDPQFSPTAQMDKAGMWIPGTGEFCLQNIEADRIGSPIDPVNKEDYIGGVSIDLKTGRPISHKVFRRTRMGTYVDPQECLVENVIHVFDGDQPAEYRGRTKLLRLLNDARDIREMMEAEKIAFKTQSQYAVGITTKDPFNNQGAGAWSGKTAAGTPTQDALWGKVMKFSEGEGINMLSPNPRPSGAFMAAIEFLIRKMATSFDLPFEFLWSLMSLGGVNSRIVVQQATRKIEDWQHNVLRDIVLNRVRQKVLSHGIMNKQIPPHPGWKRCNWRFGPALITDLKYEMEADIQAATHGFIPIDAVMAKYDNTPHEVFTSNSATASTAVNVGAQTGNPVEVFAKGIFPDITAQRAAFLESQNPPPPPPPLSPGVIGEKSLKDVLDLQIAVGEGKIDAESARNTLVEKFGVARSVADRVIPDEPEEEDLNRAAGLTPEGEHAPVAAKSNGSSKPKTNGARK